MVKTGQSAIRAVEFASGLHPELPVEVVARRDLIGRMDRDFFTRPDRPAFDIAIVVHDGSGQHQVDFENISLLPGRLLRVRPGQVQTWDVDADLDATIVLARQGPGLNDMAPSCDLGPRSLAIARSIITALDIEQQRFDASQPSVQLMMRLFEAIDSLFDRAHPRQLAGKPAAYVAYREAIEARLGVGHRVADYAADLPFSERTITRACQSVTGLTAKGLLNQRITLEAKRLLVHTDQPAATIGRTLGFSEATNFHKFFTRQTRQRPTEFREAQAGHASRHET